MTVNGSLPNAFHAADCLLQLEPEHVDALLWRARATEGLAYAHVAVEDYQQVLELDPGHDEARSRLANVLYRVGRFAEAQEQWQHLRRGHPDHPAVLVGLARCLHQAGRLEEARQLLQPLLAAPRKNDPALAEVSKLALLEGGKLALAMKQPAQAEAWLREAVAQAPHDYEPNYALAQCLEQIGHREEARHYRTQAEHIQAEQVRLEEVLRRMVQAPGDAALRYQAGVILLRNGLEQDGLRWLQSALQEDPRHQPSHQALAEYYERSGKPDLAARHRQLALQGGQSAAGGAGGTP